MKTKRVTIHTLKKMKERGQRITMLTAYDATFSRLLDESDVDVLLVGDSLGMVVQGHDTTLPVTLDDIIYHTRAVVRAARRAHVVADMPFMTYQVSIEEAVTNAGRLLKDGGAHSVKLEGGARVVPAIQAMVAAGIPVMAHLGLTPQSFHQLGGFRVQGKEDAAVTKLLEDARAVEAAGAYALVLEGIPADVAARLTSLVSIPTIGIGAGPECDGQVLVIYDVLGMDESFNPKFVRRYESLGTRIRTAVRAYVSDVRDGAFPSANESFGVTSTPSSSATVAELGEDQSGDTDADADADEFNPYSTISRS